MRKLTFAVPERAACQHARHSRVGRLRRSVFSLHGKSVVDRNVFLLLNQNLQGVAISTIAGCYIWSLTYSLQSAVSGWNWDHANQNA